MAIVSHRAAAAARAFDAVERFYFASRYGERRGVTLTASDEMVARALPDLARSA